MLMLAKQELHSAQYATYKSTQIKNTAVSVKNEVMEMIAKVRERKGRLDLPIVSGKHLRRISDRTALQSADNAEKFITTRKIDSFESLAKFTADREQKYSQLETAHLSKGQKLNRLKERMQSLYIGCIDIACGIHALRYLVQIVPRSFRVRHCIHEVRNSQCHRQNHTKFGGEGKWICFSCQRLLPSVPVCTAHRHLDKLSFITDSQTNSPDSGTNSPASFFYGKLNIVYPA